MPVDLDLRDLGVGPVGGSGKVLDGFGAVLDYIFGYALDEYLADEVGLGELGSGREPVRVEGFS